MSTSPSCRGFCGNPRKETARPQWDAPFSPTDFAPPCKRSVVNGSSPSESISPSPTVGKSLSLRSARSTHQGCEAPVLDQDQCQIALSVNDYAKWFLSSSACSDQEVYYLLLQVVGSERSLVCQPDAGISSLDEARTFAQNAAEAALIETAPSFRIQSDDGSVNEHWGRGSDGWKLEP